MEIFKFISTELSLRAPKHGDAKILAAEIGIKEPSINHFKKYAEAKNPPAAHFRTCYKILRYLLGQPPIRLGEIQPVIVALGGEPGLPKHVRPELYFAVPLVEDRIAAGEGRLVADNIIGYVWVYKPEVGNRVNLVAVRLADDAVSMEPALHPGDIVLIDRQDKTITNKGIYAVRTSREPCAIKRLSISSGKFWLISDNPKHPPQISEFDNSEDLIIGRVIWSWTSWVSQ